MAVLMILYSQKRVMLNNNWEGLNPPIFIFFNIVKAKTDDIYFSDAEELINYIKNFKNMS